MSHATSSIQQPPISDAESRQSANRFKAYRERLRQHNDQTISESQMANSARGSQRKASPAGYVASTEQQKQHSKQMQMQMQGRSTGGPKDANMEGASSEAEQTQFRADRHFMPGGLSSDTNEWSQSRERTRTERHTGNLPSGEQERQKSTVEQFLGGSS